MKAAFALLCLLMAGIAGADLETSTTISGTGLIDLDGPGNYSQHGYALCQNWTVGFCLNESSFERRI